METEGRRKRSISEVEEDEKVEKFYALIRSFREARERRKMELNEMIMRNNNKKMKKIENGGSSIIDHKEPGWVPSFEWADFSQEVVFKSSNHRHVVKVPNRVTVMKKEKDDEEQEGGSSLDLKLTL